MIGWPACIRDTTRSASRHDSSFLRALVLCFVTLVESMSPTFAIDDFPALKASHVYIRDQRHLIRTINRILKDGANALQIVTDFDLTLTKQHVDGKKVLSSFGIFSKCKQLPDNYAKESARLYQMYRPIEIDPALPLSTKVDAMNSWMIAAEDILKGLVLEPTEIAEAVRIHGTNLRDGTPELFEKLHVAGVPILVFSAGLGDVVDSVLRQQGVFFNNVKVISNFLKFEDGKVAGFKNERLIHVFNKNEHALEQDYFKVVEQRRNVLLMGDTIGDAGMVDGMETADAVLKIGFLYEHVESSLSSYMEEYDIVLVDDQTMKVPTEILQRIL